MAKLAKKQKKQHWTRVQQTVQAACSMLITFVQEVMDVILTTYLPRMFSL